ncbi:unnamed protein product [Rotaria sp. Silwood1]|nr:unnamed protein product [Rotaria sp. Silwood1]CAF3635489.1 unnamed protein product [Rotaria sp. Silwood1]CAF4688006.1 unnamed protein product [Rotaria sp. Silwood1]CAF4757173.1 unnamed protein product [Rotaria sp. Silwood1]
MSADYERIKRQAIGRQGFIGSLYDIRNDRFEGRSLFNQTVPSSNISTTDCAHSTYIVDENESQKETFTSLNIDASMKISLMAGLFNIEGSAKYLNQTKTNSRTVRVTHILQMKTKKDHLHISMSDLCQYFSSDALENPNATHCVIGITWGANVAATFEEVLATSEEASELQGQLSACLKKPTIGISGDASVKNVDETNSKFRSLKIHISGDIKLSTVPRTVEDVFKAFSEVPSKLNELNDGKGQQLEFELYPLKRMAQIFKYEISIQRVIKDVSIYLMSRLEDTFEQIIRSKRMLNDFLDKVTPWQDWLASDWIEAITTKQTNLNRIQIDTLHQLGTLIEQIRRGEVDENKITELLDNFDTNNPCSVVSMRRFLEENSRNTIKIEALNEICRFLQEAKGENQQSTGGYSSILFPKNTTIQSFLNKNHDNDIYLLHISNKWKESDERNWYKQIRLFTSLYKSQEQNQTRKAIFRVVDHDFLVDMDEKPDKCIIYHASRGVINTKDYFHSSLVTLSQDQIRAMRTEHKLTNVTNKEIEALHKKFIAAHPSGEINEQEFSAEFQLLFPHGEPQRYCNYAFSVLDKNNSGTLTFDEYIAAYSLTLPGDIEHQLALTFQLCAYHGQDKVSNEDLLQLMEAVAELKGVDSSAISLFAKTIMKITKSEKDEKITKEEFIRRLKENYDLCMAFLPIEVKKTAATQETPKRLDSLGNDDMQLIQNFLTDYDNSVTWQLTHTQNIERILKPKLEIFFKQLGCNSTTDIQNRIDDLISKYREVLTIWRTHYQNIFLGLQPLLKDEVLSIRNAYNTGNN